MKIPSPSKDNRDQSSDRSSGSSDEDDSGNSKKSPQKNDFSEYMWMENEEEFDKEVMKQLEEEALMEQCIEAMLEDELDDKNSMFSNMGKDFENLGIQEKEEIAKNSKLNPNAAEFVPRSGTP